jgi:hypothetical protein
VDVFVQIVRIALPLLAVAGLALVLLASPASAAGASALSGPCQPDSQLGQKAECVIVCLSLGIVTALTTESAPESLVCGTW